jgi:hypothetical protein
MPCPICGQNCKNYTPAPGAGITVTRLGERSNHDMAKVTLSKERWYVTADKTRAVKAGDPDAAFLLVGKDAAIAPEVAAHYGIATYAGEAVERVTQSRDQERERMVSQGTSKETAENYAEMSLKREVIEQVAASVTTEGNRSGGRQAAMMAEAMIHERRQEGTLVSEEDQGKEPTSRTKDIPAPGSGSNPASTPPTEGEKTQEGQAGEQPLSRQQDTA